jgi:hypothetical protein
MERFAPRGFSRIRISLVMHKASLQECGARSTNTVHIQRR